MKLKTLPEEVTRELLKFEEDILTPLAERDRTTRATTPCPRCGGHFRKQFDSRRAFSPDRPLARFFYRCFECGYTVDPETGFVIAMGNPAKAEDPFKLNVDDT